MSKKLIMHIGHGKTGSSYVQSVASLSANYLKSQGIIYPDTGNNKWASKGNITNGNEGILKRLRLLNGSDTYCVSSESIFSRIRREPAELDRILDHFDGNIEVYLYTRNVMEFLFSIWGQSVKRGGSIRSLDQFLIKAKDAHHQNATWWLKQSQALGFKLHVKNYSYIKRNIHIDFFGSFVDTNNLVLPTSSRVNRSMSFSEYECQRVLNSLYGKNASFVSDKLVNNLPDQPIKKMTCSRGAHAAVVERYTPILAELNSFMPSDHNVIIESSSDVCHENADGLGELSSEQIAIIAEGVKSLGTFDGLGPINAKNLRSAYAKKGAPIAFILRIKSFLKNCILN